MAGVWPRLARGLGDARALLHGGAERDGDRGQDADDRDDDAIAQRYASGERVTVFQNSGS